MGGFENSLRVLTNSLVLEAGDFVHNLEMGSTILCFTLYCLWPFPWR